jgi:hypothetical protein
VKWPETLRVNPLPSLLAADNEALRFFVRRDLMDEEAGPVDALWELPEAQKLIKKQQENGSWRYPGKNRNVYTEINYDLLETFRSLGILVEKYGFHGQYPAIGKAAEYVLSCQTEEGDIRGVLGKQYMPYYHAILCELLIKVGYGEDARIEKGIDWLLTMRQDDGGWIVPMQAVPAKEKTREMWSAPPVLPERGKPSSHLATGMVLRAFATHPAYSQLAEARLAANLLKSRFLEPDKYGDRKAPQYWTKFQFPFWWSNLLTALDSLSLMGFPEDDGDVQKGLDWFVSNQQDDGLWKTSYELAKRREVTAKEKGAMLWVGLAVCRILRRFLG